MEKQGSKFNLLNGTFTDAEAKEILVTLFTDKIRFHSQRNFSHEERFGKPERHARERIPELKKALEAILIFLEQRGEETSYEIHADIQIRPLISH